MSYVFVLYVMISYLKNLHFGHRLALAVLQLLSVENSHLEAIKAQRCQA